jgi:hypothetical protein
MADHVSFQQPYDKWPHFEKLLLYTYNDFLLYQGVLPEISRLQNVLLDSFRLLTSEMLLALVPASPPSDQNCPMMMAKLCFYYKGEVDQKQSRGDTSIKSRILE